jgi:hypothetical protein
MIPIFIDIDGTIADNSHREHYLYPPAGQPQKKDWESFYHPANVRLDTPIKDAYPHLARIMNRPDRYEPYLLTGRPERTRLVTCTWVSEHFGLSQFNLIMRSDTDRRKATTYKQNAIEVVLKGRPGIFIDDDLRNVEMYSRYGIFLQAPFCWRTVCF